MKRMLVLLVLGLAGLTQAAGILSAEENVTGIPNDNLQMATAIAKAQETLADFLALVENPPVGAQLFVLKVGISDGTQTEHFWVTPFRRVGDRFIGTIDNDPVLVKTVTAGAEYTFERNEISDWGYTFGGKLHGYHTLRALLPYMDKEKAEHFKSILAEP